MTGYLKFARYLLVGGSAAGVNWLSRFAWSLIAPYSLAVVLAYATGMVWAFLLFRRFVFPDAAAPIETQIRNFVLVNLIGMGLTVSISAALVYWLFPAIGFDFYPEAIAHGLSIGAPTITSWFGHKHLTFSPAGARREPPSTPVV